MKQNVANEVDVITALMMAEEAKANGEDMQKFLMLYFTDSDFCSAYHDYVWEMNQRKFSPA